MGAELAFDVLVAEKAHFRGQVFAVGAQEAAVEGDRWEKGWRRRFEAGRLGADGGGEGEEAGGDAHGGLSGWCPGLRSEEGMEEFDIEVYEALEMGIC